MGTSRTIRIAAMAIALANATSTVENVTIVIRDEDQLETAKRQNVAVIGVPILSADAEGCKKALKDGICMFSLCLDSLGFRN